MSFFLWNQNLPIIIPQKKIVTYVRNALPEVEAIIKPIIRRINAIISTKSLENDMAFFDLIIILHPFQNRYRIISRLFPQ